MTMTTSEKKNFPKDLPCEHCGKCYSTENSLRNHVRIKHGVRKRKNSKSNNNSSVKSGDIQGGNISNKPVSKAKKMVHLMETNLQKEERNLVEQLNLLNIHFDLQLENLEYLPVSPPLSPRNSLPDLNAHLFGLTSFLHSSPPITPRGSVCSSSLTSMSMSDLTAIPVSPRKPISTSSPFSLPMGEGHHLPQRQTENNYFYSN
eukprot:Pgem_evm1s10962